jgi:hypothetical protein
VKRLAELTAEDLAANPVWRYEGGTGAQALVEPAKQDTLSRMDDEIFLAATAFELFDSTKHSGFCFPADDSGIDYLQPVIVSGSRHVSFWFDTPAKPELLESLWKALGKEPGEIFPVTFRCLVPVDGRMVSGRISGFESSQDLRSGGSPSIPEDADTDDHSSRTLTARPVQARRDTGAVEKRTARRRNAEMTVEFVQDAFRGTGITGNLSRRGMFVRSSRIPGAGPALKLTVKLPDGRKLVLNGRVIRTVADASPSATASGFGVRFSDDSPEYDDLFSQLRDKPE